MEVPPATIQIVHQQDSVECKCMRTDTSIILLPYSDLHNLQLMIRQMKKTLCLAKQNYRRTQTIDCNRRFAEAFCEAAYLSLSVRKSGSPLLTGIHWLSFFFLETRQAKLLSSI